MAKKKNNNGYSSRGSSTSKIVLICVICALVGGLLIGGLSILIYRDLSNSGSGQVTTANGEDPGDNLADGEIFDYEAAGYLKLGPYKGLKADVMPEDTDVYADMIYATEEEEDENGDPIKLDKKKYPISDVVADGDVVNVDFSAKLNGEELEDASSKDEYLWIGKEEYIEDFENGIVGIKTGEKKTVDCTFPSDYDDEDLAGKTVQFTIKVNSRFGEDWAKCLSNGKCKTVQEYFDQTKETLIADNRASKGEYVWDSIKENTTVESVPENYLEQLTVDTTNMYTNFAEMSGTTVEDLLSQFGMDENGIAEIAQDTLIDIMIAKTIASKEKLTMDDTTYHNLLKEMVAEDPNTDQTLEELEAEYKENQGSHPRDEMLVEHIRNYVGEQSKE
nr:FKBP-type peptidyl-prolyl cis-trans isomerase [Eubacterium sp.]